MTKCWKDDPNLRPSFEKLRNKLKEMENRHKAELKILQRDSLCSFFPFQSLIARSTKLDSGVTMKVSKRSLWFQFMSLYSSF